jgi:hypothetical protein
MEAADALKPYLDAASKSDIKEIDLGELGKSWGFIFKGNKIFYDQDSLCVCILDKDGEPRELDVYEIEGLKPFNESLKGKLSFLEGKPISLIKTLHTVSGWNDENREMNKTKRDEDFEGFIGKIGDYDGYDTPGFWVMDNNGKKKGFVMYDKKTGNFIEGNSAYHYTYQGKTEKDKRTLQLVLDNLS